MWCSCHDIFGQIGPIGGLDVLQFLRKSGGQTNIFQVKNKKKVTLACRWFCKILVIEI